MLSVDRNLLDVQKHSRIVASVVLGERTVFGEHRYFVVNEFVLLAVSDGSEIRFLSRKYYSLHTFEQMRHTYLIRKAWFHIEEVES